MEALVDTGATYTLLLSDMLNSLGIISVGQREFELADQGSVRYDVGDARLRLNESELTAVGCICTERHSSTSRSDGLGAFKLGCCPL